MIYARNFRAMKAKLAKAGLALIVLNEIRGVAVVAVILWGWYG